jgi:hypothetical protein
MPLSDDMPFDLGFQADGDVSLRSVEQGRRISEDFSGNAKALDKGAHQY